MNQRFRSLQQLGENFQELRDRALREGEASHRVRIPRVAGSRRTGGLKVLLSAPVVIAAAVVLIILLTGHGGSGPAPAQRLTGEEASLAADYVVLTLPQTEVARASADSGPAPALNRAIFTYPVLAHPQSPAARAGARTGPARFLSGISGLNLTGSEGSLHFHVRTVGWAPYRNIPSLTREVTVNGVRVWFFVVYHPITRALPTMIVTGNDPKGAARYTTKSYRKLLRRHVNSTAGYQLWVQMGDKGTPQPIAPARVLAARANSAALLGRLDTAKSADLKGYLTTENAMLSGPHGTIVAVVPREVARLSWIWPRDFESSTLSFLPRLTESATVTDNVAVLHAPARYTSGAQFSPETVVYYRADGSVLARYTNPGDDTLQSEHTFEAQTTPGPQTTLSRRAQRDPSTPNRVLVLPDVTKLTRFKIPGRHRTFYQLTPTPLLVFNPLLNHRYYYARVTGGPRPACDDNYPSRLVKRAEARRDAFRARYGHDTNVRGSTYSGLFVTVSCRGTYRIAVSVLNNHALPYKPFATVTLTVR